MRKRKLRGRRLQKQRRVIIASSLAITFLLCTGYAAFSTNISLNAKGNIKDKPASEKIIENETVQDSSSTADGLYKDTAEEPIDGKYRYIYKGADPDNYIEFNDEVWRIYSLEPDGSIKIVRSELLSDTKIFDSTNARPTESNSYCDYSSSYGCNAWAANSNLVETPSKFTNGGKTGTVTTDSQMLTYLNKDTSGNYYNTLSSTAKGQIITHDWNVGPAGTWNDTLSASDLLSTNYEGKYKWNGKVALLTKSEYMRANSNTSSCSTASTLFDNRNTCKGTNYLFISSYNQWLLSPHSGDSNSVFGADAIGFIGNYGSNNTYGVRPALYLSPSITITGKGTNDSNIYKIEE